MEVYTRIIPSGLVFEWAELGKGYGSITLRLSQRGDDLAPRWYCDTEGDGEEKAIEVLTAWVKRAEKIG